MVRPEIANMAAPESNPSVPFVLDAPESGTLRVELVDRVGPVHALELEPRDPRCLLIADLAIEAGKPLPFTLTFESSKGESGVRELRVLLQTKNATSSSPIAPARRSSPGAHLTRSSVHDPIRLMPGHYMHLAWWIWTRSDGTPPIELGPPPVREDAPEPAWYLRVRFSPLAKK